MGDLLSKSLNCECFISGWLALCLAAFMPGPSNINVSTGVSSYKYTYSYEKVIEGLIFNSLNLKIHINPLPCTTLICFQALAQFNEIKFVKFKEAYCKKQGKYDTARDSINLGDM